MYYHFEKDMNDQCMLICGDVGGNVRVLLFSPVKRGPFKNEAGRALITLRHIDLQRRVDVNNLLNTSVLFTIMAVWYRVRLRFCRVDLSCIKPYVNSCLPTLASLAAGAAPGGAVPHARRVGPPGLVLRIAALRRVLLHLPRLVTHVRHAWLQDAQYV